MTRYDPPDHRSSAANVLGTVAGVVVVVLAAVGYEHILDSLDLYEWQRLDDPSLRTVPFLAGLLVVVAFASTSGLWVASRLRRVATTGARSRDI